MFTVVLFFQNSSKLHQRIRTFRKIHTLKITYFQKYVLSKLRVFSKKNVKITTFQITYFFKKRKNYNFSNYVFFQKNAKLQLFKKRKIKITTFQKSRNFQKT